MPESLLERRLKLGTYLGIPLYVHWSFSLAIIYVAISTVHSGLVGIAFSMAQLFGVFLCVTLHEYGHSMAARLFGISTADITLLPFGGVARLKRMPRTPWKEFIVAVAGPAVNVVIATGLISVLAFAMPPEMFAAIGTYANALLLQGPIAKETLIMVAELITTPSLIGYGILLLAVNLMLVVFNMIPAFPMDGGRVFRAMMAMFVNYQLATNIAARVGIICAVFMGIYAVQNSQWFLLFIAFFVSYSGLAEARQVNMSEAFHGITVDQVMVRRTQAWPMDMPLCQLAEEWQAVPQTALPVVAPDGSPVGMISINQVSGKISSGTDPLTATGELIGPGGRAPEINRSENLDSAVMKVDKQIRQAPVVNDAGLLVGVLDLDSLKSRAELLHDLQAAASNQSSSITISQSRFNAVN